MKEKEKEKEKEVIEFPKVHSHGAGIDIGSRDIFVSIDGKECISYKTFTKDYEKCCKYLKEKGIKYRSAVRCILTRRLL